MRKKISMVVVAALASQMMMQAQAAQQQTPPPAQTTTTTTQTTSAPASVADLPDAPSTTANLQAPPPPVQPTGPTAVIDTSMGRLTCKLFANEAPVTVNNFIGLAEGTKEWTDPRTQRKVRGRPFYRGLTFHRVIPDFMIQGGDPLGDGTGDAGYFFNDEINPALNFDVPGRMAMANAGPNTNGAQFFITESAQPELNQHYNIFGQCDPVSVAVVKMIARVPRNPSNDKPYSPVTINKITIVRDGQPMPPEPSVPANTTPQSGAQPSAYPQH